MFLIPLILFLQCNDSGPERVRSIKPFSIPSIVESTSSFLEYVKDVEIVHNIATIALRPIDLVGEKEKSNIERKGIEFLVSREVNLKKRADGFYPIHISVINGEEKIVSILSEYYDLESDDGLLPIHYAALKGNVNLMKTILDNSNSDNLKDHINIRDKRGRTPLHYAALSGSIEIIRFIKDRGGKYLMDSDEVTPIHFAALNYLMNKKIDLERLEDDKSRVLGVKFRDSRILDQIIYLYQDEKKNFVTGKHTFADTTRIFPYKYARYDESGEELKKDLQSKTELDLALEVVSNAEPCSFYIGPPFEDVEGGEVFKMVQHRDKNGFSPLHYAAISGDREILDSLHSHYDKFAERNTKEKKGNRMTKFRPSTFEWRWSDSLFISNKSDNEFINQVSPMDLACYYNNQDIVERYSLFIRKTFGTQDKIDRYATFKAPLHYAAMNNNQLALTIVLDGIYNSHSIWSSYEEKGRDFKDANGDTFKDILEKRGEKRERKRYDEKYVLHNLAEEGNIKEIKRIISENYKDKNLANGYDFNLQTDEGVTVKHILAELEYHETLHSIYHLEELRNRKRGVEIRYVQDNEGNTPVHYSLKKVANLSINNAFYLDPDIYFIKNNSGDYPIHVAIKNQDILSLKEMCEDNIFEFRFLRDGEMKTPLIAASQISEQKVRRDIIKLMYKRNNFVMINHSLANLKDIYGKRAIEYLYDFRDYKSIEVLLNSGANLNMSDRDGYALPMRVVDEIYKMDRATALIIEHTSFNILSRYPDGDTILHRAIKKGKDNFVRHIFKRDDISKIFGEKNGEGESALSIAVRKNNGEVIKLFLEYGINIVKNMDMNLNSLAYRENRSNSFLKGEVFERAIKDSRKEYSFDLSDIQSIDPKDLLSISIALKEVELAKRALNMNPNVMYEKDFLREAKESGSREIFDLLKKS